VDRAVDEVQQAVIDDPAPVTIAVPSLVIDVAVLWLIVSWAKVT
jgi:hypothetical protein